MNRLRHAPTVLAAVLAYYFARGVQGTFSWNAKHKTA